MIRTGLEKLLTNPPAYLSGKRLGLLANPASIDSVFRHAKDLVAKAFPGQLKALFSPQHGFFAEKQDNMIESDHMRDPVLGIPIFSLYGETRKPTPEMLSHIDVLLVDIQDVGTRVYTFIYTVSYCMEAAKEAGVKVVILDRPNPASGAIIEGNLLEEEYASFVGRYPIPMRHGLTIGEFCLYINERHAIGADLEIIPMDGWKREMFFGDTGLPWVLPSPNMPTPDTALVYPGQVIWEGTNVSEGRGTTRPFEFFGAPWLEPEKILGRMPEKALAGSILRPMAFEPTSGKHAGIPCKGFQIHVTDPKIYPSYFQSLSFLSAIIQEHPEHFAFKNPPYEYEFEKLPMDLILGSRNLRELIEAGEDMGKLRENWKDQEEAYKEEIRPFLLY
ncbi:DUF1343 domain-containing protein [Desulfococcaceae bacterium OttesenSCG-928-F15]|nr:DUF1343 domain-containing protein [Desulfococcaceae bacterium OttesenSCG-928-F15]